MPSKQGQAVSFALSILLFLKQRTDETCVSMATSWQFLLTNTILHSTLIDHILKSRD